jgi:hypothetical protein
MGCAGDHPVGTYRLKHGPNGGGHCTPLPQLTGFEITSDGLVRIYGESVLPSVLESARGPDEAANIQFDVTAQVYIGIIDSVPTTIYIRAHYELWGDAKLTGTAYAPAGLSEGACAHAVESID